MIKPGYTTDRPRLKRWLEELEDVDDALGTVIVLTHPDGPKGGAMARINEIKEGNDEYIVTAHDVLRNSGYRTWPDRYPPCAGYPQDGATYTVYSMEHQKGNGSWTRTTPWISSKFWVRGYHAEDYTGHENQRMKFKRATFTRDWGKGQAEEIIEISEGTIKTP